MLTDEVFSLPLVLSGADGDFKSNVTFDGQGGLYANSPVSVHDCTINWRFNIKDASDLVGRFEARASYIDQGSSEHVSAFRSELQLQISSVYNKILQARSSTPSVYRPISLLQLPSRIFSSILKMCRPLNPLPHPLPVKSLRTVPWL